MKPLKLIKQRDSSGCTIACMAMIVGKSYYGMRKFLDDHQEQIKSEILSKSPSHVKHFYMDEGSFRTGFYDQEIMDTMRIVMGKKVNFVEFRSLKDLKNNCILTITDIAGTILPNRHAVVYDAIYKQILDPSICGVVNNKLTGFNVVTCLEVL